MKVGVVGIGEMGMAMAGHLLDHDIEVAVFDVNQEKLGKARERGLATKESLARTGRCGGCVHSCCGNGSTGDRRFAGTGRKRRRRSYHRRSRHY